MEREKESLEEERLAAVINQVRLCVALKHLRIICFESVVQNQITYIKLR